MKNLQDLLNMMVKQVQLDMGQEIAELGVALRDQGHIIAANRKLIAAEEIIKYIKDVQNKEQNTI